MTRPEALADMRARLFPAASALLFVSLSAHTAHAEQLPLEGGLYEITSRLEPPHLERWAIDQTVSICLPNGTRMRSDFPLPVLAANNAFAGCLAENVQRTGASLELRYRLLWTGCVQSEGDLRARARGIPRSYLDDDGREEYDHDRGANWSSPRRLRRGGHSAELTCRDAAGIRV